MRWTLGVGLLALGTSVALAAVRQWLGVRVWLRDGRRLEAAALGGFIGTNLPWLSQVVPLPVCAVYVAGVLVLYALVAWASARASAHAWALIQRGLIGCIGLTVAVQLAVLWLVRPSVRVVMDRDSALLTWVATLGRAEFPYAYPTTLGNPITPFPLMPAVAFPFIVLGNIGYTEVVAYVCLAMLLWTRYASRPVARAISLLVLSSAPLVYLEVLTRSDLIVNSLLLILLLVFLEANDQALPQTRTIAVVGVGIGCLMGTRLGLFPALGVVIVYLLRRIGPVSFAKVSLVAGATFAVIVGPFLLWNPTIFTTYAPLGANAGKLHVSPLAGTLWPVATGLTVVASGLLARRADDLYLGVAVVMLVVTLGTYLSGFIDVSYFQLSFIPLLFALSRWPSVAAPPPVPGRAARAYRAGALDGAEPGARLAG